MPSGERLEKNAFAVGEKRGDGAGVPTIHLELHGLSMKMNFGMVKLVYST